MELDSSSKNLHFVDKQFAEVLETRYIRLVRTRLNANDETAETREHTIRRNSQSATYSRNLCVLNNRLPDTNGTHFRAKVVCTRAAEKRNIELHAHRRSRKVVARKITCVSLSLNLSTYSVPQQGHRSSTGRSTNVQSIGATEYSEFLKTFSLQEPNHSGQNFQMQSLESWKESQKIH